VGSLRGSKLPLYHRTNPVKAPTVSYAFDVKNVHMFYHQGDNSMNFSSHEDDGRIEIYGIDADDMFQCAGNALCCNMSILDQIKPKPWQLERAHEMIAKLQAFVDKHEKAD